MVKNSKKSKEPAAPGNGLSAPENAAPSPAATGKPVQATTNKTPAAKPAKAAAGPKSAGKRAGKAPAPRKPQAATGARKTPKAGQTAISDEDIRIRAYFISEKRIQSGLPGDSGHDWLEAHRQLQEEAGRRA